MKVNNIHTEKLFSYGTLQYEAVQHETFGRKLDGKIDTLVGYCLSTVQITDPKVIAASGESIHRILTFTGNKEDQVKGMVFDISPEELQKADEYEVDDYKRISVQLFSGTRAWVYVDASQGKIIPQDYHTVSPYLIIKNAASAIEFYKKAFGADELMRMTMPDGKIGFAEIKIGDSLILLSDEYPEMGVYSPTSLNGSPVRIHLYIEDVDAFANQAIAAGAKIIRPLQDQFFGDRSGVLEDPFGHFWSIATRKENISREEMKKRFEEMMKQQK